MQKTLKRYFPIFVLPTLLAFAVAFLIPFIMGIYLSFCNFTTVIDARFTGISNYARMFSNQDFLSALSFTARFTVVSVILINAGAFLLALALTKGIQRNQSLPNRILYAQSDRRHRAGIYLAADHQRGASAIRGYHNRPTQSTASGGW